MRRWQGLKPWRPRGLYDHGTDVPARLALSHRERTASPGAQRPSNVTSTRSQRLVYQSHFGRMSLKQYL